jgi:catalase
VHSEDPAGTAAGPAEPAKPLTASHSLTAKSVIFDAVLVADGRRSTDVLRTRPDVAEFLRQAYRHGKTIGVWGSGRDVLAAARLNDEQRDAAVGHGAGTPAEEGVLVADGGAPEDAALSEFTAAFGAAVGRHRAWDRTLPTKTV